LNPKPFTKTALVSKTRQTRISFAWQLLHLSLGDLPFLNRYIWVHGTRAIQRSSSAGVRPVCLGWHPVVSAVRCATHASLCMFVHSYYWHAFPAPWTQCSCVNAIIDAAWLAGLMVLSDPWTHTPSTTQWKLFVLLWLVSIASVWFVIPTQHSRELQCTALWHSLICRSSETSQMPLSQVSGSCQHLFLLRGMVLSLLQGCY